MGGQDLEHGFLQLLFEQVSELPLRGHLRLIAHFKLSLVNNIIRLHVAEIPGFTLGIVAKRGRKSTRSCLRPAPSANLTIRAQRSFTAASLAFIPSKSLPSDAEIMALSALPRWESGNSFVASYLLAKDITHVYEMSNN